MGKDPTVVSPLLITIRRNGVIEAYSGWPIGRLTEEQIGWFTWEELASRQWFITKEDGTPAFNPDAVHFSSKEEALADVLKFFEANGKLQMEKYGRIVDERDLRPHELEIDLATKEVKIIK